MKKLFFLFCVCCFSATELSAQLLYQRAYPAWGGGPDQDVVWSPLDHGYYIASMGSTGIQLVQTDSTGTVTRRTSYSPESPYNYTSVNVEVREDGFVYLSGLCDVLSAYVSYYILALDPLGNVLWTKTYTTTSVATYTKPRLKLLDDDNLLIIESVTGRVGFIKTDPYGNVIASESFRQDTTAENKTPGFAGDVFPDGSLIFTGKHLSDIMVVHSDNMGNILWTSIFNSGSQYYHTKGVLAMDDGTSILCGFGGGEAFVMKLDSLGNMQWYNAYAGPGVYYSISLLNDSTFIVDGLWGYDRILSKFDLDGNLLETIRFGDASTPVGFMHFTVSSNGALAVPVDFYSTISTVQGSGLFIMEPGSGLGCAMDTIVLQPSTTSQDPSMLAIPIYQVEQSVVVNSFVSTKSTLNNGFTSDLCLLLSTEPGSRAQPQELTLQGSPVSEGNPLTFALHSNAGDIGYLVTDPLGRVVLNSKLTHSPGSRTVVPGTDQLAPGMYVFTVISGEKTYSEKFIVR